MRRLTEKQVKIIKGLCRAYLALAVVATSVILALFVVPVKITDVRNDILVETKAPIGNYLIANAYYEKVPSGIREHFEASQWSVVMTQKSVEDMYAFHFKGVVGVCSHQEKRIFLESSGSGAMSVVHEMGHYVDGVLKVASASKAWKDIWMEEGCRISDYATTSPAEGFAEAFEKTFLKGETFAKKCPKAYAYIMRVCGYGFGIEDAF